MYNILITSVGGTLAPYLINKIKNGKFKDLKITGTNQSSNCNAKYFLDNFVVTPSGKSVKYINNIKRIIKKYKIDLLIPGSDEEALNLSKNINDFKKTKCTIATIDYKTLYIFSDKIRTYKSLKEKNLPFPEFDIIKNFKEIKKKIKDFNKKDFVIKPSLSRGGRNVLVVRSDIKKVFFKNYGRETHVPTNKINNKHFLMYKKIFFPLVISERLREPTFDLDMLAYRGKSIRVVSRKRLNSAEPNAGHIVKRINKLENIGKNLIKKFNLSWLYDCDLMIDEKGEYKIIEINPRMSGSSVVSVEAGYPLFDDMISILRNKKIKKINKPINKIIFPYTSLGSIKKIK